MPRRNADASRRRGWQNRTPPHPSPLHPRLLSPLSPLISGQEPIAKPPADWRCLQQFAVLAPGNLEPGAYTAVCFVDIPDGIPHVVRGMVAEFTVE